MLKNGQRWVGKVDIGSQQGQKDEPVGFEGLGALLGSAPNPSSALGH